MAKKEKSKNKPDIKAKSGIFQIAGWKKTVIIPAKNDYDIERERKYVNLCLSVGIKNNGKWENMKAFFRVSQFGNLKEAVDEFAEQLTELNEKELGLNEEGED